MFLLDNQCSNYVILSLTINRWIVLIFCSVLHYVLFPSCLIESSPSELGLTEYLYLIAIYLLKLTILFS